MSTVRVDVDARDDQLACMYTYSTLTCNICVYIQMCVVLAHSRGFYEHVRVNIKLLVICTVQARDVTSSDKLNLWFYVTHIKENTTRCAATLLLFSYNPA